MLALYLYQSDCSKAYLYMPSFSASVVSLIHSASVLDFSEWAAQQPTLYAKSG